MAKLTSFQRQFQQGRWNTYVFEKLEDDLRSLTLGQLEKKFIRHNNEFIIQVNCFALEQLLCFTLDLEEKPKKRKQTIKRKLGRSHKRRDMDDVQDGGQSPSTAVTLTTRKPMVSKYKFALSVDEELLFCHRLINNKTKRLLMDTIFDCENIMSYPLNGSPPLNLFLFYKQARIADSLFPHQFEQLIIDRQRKGLSLEQSGDEVRKELGCEDNIPKIQQIQTTLLNPLCYLDSGEKVRLTNVDFELRGESIIESYLSLGTQDVLQRAPEWLIACRKSGKSHRSVSFQRVAA